MFKAMRIPFLMLIVAGLLVFSGCNRIPGPTAPAEPTDVHASTWAYNGDFVVDRVAGCGTVSIAFTWDYIFVKYTVASGYSIAATHLHIATTKNGIPHDANGVMLPGSFAYRDTFNPDKTTYTYAIPNTAAWRNAGFLYIAAHARVHKPGGLGEGWAYGSQFAGRYWGMFITYDTPKTLHLPTELVHAQYSKVTNCGFGYAPSEFHVWDVGSGFSIPNDGYYPAFCLDLHTYIYPQAYSAKLWSSYDPTMPDYILNTRDGHVPVPYDQINWLLNEQGPPPYDDATINLLQHIFWYWRGNLTWDQLTSDEQWEAAESETHIGYIPHAGQYFGVLIDMGETVQLQFVVLDP